MSELRKKDVEDLLTQNGVSLIKRKSEIDPVDYYKDDDQNSQWHDDWDEWEPNSWGY